jgi:ABC-type cobalamin/Fe3+-siderophores transport system ATPase subunit
MSFTFRQGEVTGFAGPNGAGKSTTIRVILGLDAVDEGNALIEGQPYRSLRYPLKHAGSLLEAVLVSPGRRPAGAAPHVQAEDASTHLTILTAAKVQAILDTCTPRTGMNFPPFEGNSSPIRLNIRMP